MATFVVIVIAASLTMSGVEVVQFLHASRRGRGMKPSRPMTPSFAVTTHSGKVRTVSGITVMTPDQ